jgi:hypothetical protein
MEYWAIIDGNDFYCDRIYSIKNFLRNNKNSTAEN